MTTNTKGKLLAIAAATFFSVGAFAEGQAATTSTASDAVHCSGINSCKGATDCKTAENACKGKNVCKGHGFVVTTKADCAKKGGKVFEQPKAK